MANDSKYDKLRAKNLGDMTKAEVKELHKMRQKREKARRDSYDSTYIHGRVYETSYNTPLMDDNPKTIPNVAISPVTHLIQGFNFILTLNNFTYGFKEISGFKIENPVDYIQEGGVNDHKLIVGMPSEETPTLECRRGLMIRSAPIFSNASRALAALVQDDLARKAALMAVNAQDPQATLEQGPALGTIEVYDINKKLCAMYTFLSLGMRSWECDGLSADSSGILIESITIAHTGLTRVPVGAPNTFFGYIPAKTEEQGQKKYDTKNWLKFDLDRLKKLNDQADYLNKLKTDYESRKKGFEDRRKDREKKLKELKDYYKNLLKNLEAPDKAAKDAEAKKRKDYKEAAEKVEKAKEAAAVKNAEKEAAAKQAAYEAKKKAEADREKQIEDRQKELDAQTEATEAFDKALQESDKATKKAAESSQKKEKAKAIKVEKAKEAAAVKNAEKEAAAKQAAYEAKKKAEADRKKQVANRQKELDAQTEATEKSDKEREAADKSAAKEAEKARSEAKDKAAQAEAEKQGGSK